MPGSSVSSSIQYARDSPVFLELRKAACEHPPAPLSSVAGEELRGDERVVRSRPPAASTVRLGASLRSFLRAGWPRSPRPSSHRPRKHPCALQCPGIGKDSRDIANRLVRSRRRPRTTRFGPVAGNAWPNGCSSSATSCSSACHASSKWPRSTRANDLMVPYWTGGMPSRPASAVARSLQATQSMK